jgi:hypothetical protein
VINLKAKSIGDTHLDLYWEYFCDIFDKSRVYLSTSKIYDPYGASKIIDLSTLLKEYTDPHQYRVRIEGLQPNTHYYVCVEVEDKTSRKGYIEKTFLTLPVGEVDVIVI